MGAATPKIGPTSLEAPSAAAAVSRVAHRKAPNICPLDVPSIAAADAATTLTPLKNSRNSQAKKAPIPKDPNISPLDVPSSAASDAATTLTPLKHSRNGPPMKAPVPKEPDISPLDVSSTAAASQAATTLSPLKNSGNGPPLSSRYTKAEQLPSYKDAVDASHALTIVTSHNDVGSMKRPASALNAVEYSEAVRFLDTLRSRSKEGDVYTQFLDILGSYQQGKCRPHEVSRRVTVLFHKNRHPDLAEEMYKWTPWQDRFHMPYTGCTRAY